MTDSGMTEPQFREHVRRLVKTTCGSSGALARKHGIHPKALTLFLSGARGPSAEVAKAFGFERRYVPAQAIEARSAKTEGLGPKDESAVPSGMRPPAAAPGVHP